MDFVHTLTEMDSVRESMQSQEMPSEMNPAVKDQLLGLMLELRFLEVSYMCLENCPAEAAKGMNIASVITNMEAILKEAGQGLNEVMVEDLDAFTRDLLEKVEHFKLENGEIICTVMLNRSWEFKSYMSDEVLEFLNSVIKNLKDLVKWKVPVEVSFESQVKILEEKLRILRNLVDFLAKRLVENQKLEGFLDHVNDWVNKASTFSLLYWLDATDEHMIPRLQAILLDLLLKIRPRNPEILCLFVGVLKDSKSSAFGPDKLLTGQIVADLVDFLLIELGDPLKDYVQTLTEGLTFLISFSMDSPEVSARETGDRLFKQTNEAIKEVASLICSLYKDEINEDTSPKMEVCLSALEYKIDKLKAEVRDLYVQDPNSSFFKFPTTNGIGYIDFFLGNLRKLLECKDSSIPLARGKVATVEEELLSIRPFLKSIAEHQNEHKEEQDLYKQMINSVYQAEHVINLCAVPQHPIWYDMLCLDCVVEDIRLIGIEVKKMNDQMQNARLLGIRTNSSQLHLNEANTSRLDEVIVGLDEEAEAIIGRLTRGTTQLDILSIVGMPGIGKTTLAKKVYNSPNVTSYFNKWAWCCVSQVYKTRQLLLDILTDLGGDNAQLFDSKEEDLAEQLWKSLRELRYIIVMDDIWEVGAWYSIKYFLPDDNNGSRVVFTSRIHGLVSQVKADSNPYPLRLLGDEESWELLQSKVFHKNSCPPDLVEIGRNIAKNCKGLPLAVVLVAGIIARICRTPERWKQIEESTVSQIASEGCMEVLELSYKHLPDSLKPCFLYIGAFPEDRDIRARKLINLWIAEGFVPRIDGKSLYDVAEGYLIDLIGRSLVMISQRSSSGEVKACRVHDLIRDLCLAKIKEEMFLEWVHEYDLPHYSSNPKKYEKYRLCIDSDWTKFIDLKPGGTYVHSLLVFGNCGPNQRHSNPSTFFESFKLLDVLDLECISLNCSFPVEIISLVHLTYLALRCRTYSLPSSISNLWKLETFTLKSSLLIDISLPSTFWTMKSLRHVDFSSVSLTGIEDAVTFQLDNLDTFSTPNLNSGRETEELLRRLPRLRKLKCNFLEKQFNYKPYKFPALSCLNGLESLKVYSYGQVLFGEKRDQYPAFSFPSTLRRLTLGRFRLPWEAISIIGQLPNLEVLKLQANAFSGKRWVVEDGEFLKLKFLELSQMDFEQWSVSDDPFPCLEHITMKHCYMLEEIPSSLGYIPTLNAILVLWCFEASSSARKILQEQQENGNDGLEVIVVG